MTNIYPHILGYTNNTLLDKYFEKYFLNLKDFLKGKIADEIIISEFLLIPDISTTVEYIQRGSPDIKEKFIFLSEEWIKFSQERKDKMFSLQGDTIPWTHIRLTISDKNPDNHIDIHPDHSKENVGLGWGDINKNEWLGLYAEAFSILHTVSPGFSHELDRMIKKIIPMGVSTSKHNSWSFSSCIGHLYMSYPTHMDHPELAVLEAIIHESNHNKLNLIMKNDPLILNTREEIYYSPYRPDARHIHGIYLGLHAMVAVFYIFFSAHQEGVIMLNEPWIEKSLAYVMKNGLSIRVLKKYGAYTPLGQDILDEMIAVHIDTQKIIRTIKINDLIKKKSESVVREHFSLVVNTYPGLHY